MLLCCTVDVMDNGTMKGIRLDQIISLIWMKSRIKCWHSPRRLGNVESKCESLIFHGDQVIHLCYIKSSPQEPGCLISARSESNGVKLRRHHDTMVETVSDHGHKIVQDQKQDRTA